MINIQQLIDLEYVTDTRKSRNIIIFEKYF